MNNVINNIISLAQYCQKRGIGPGINHQGSNFNLYAGIQNVDTTNEEVKKKIPPPSSLTFFFSQEVHGERQEVRSSPFFLLSFFSFFFTTRSCWGG